LACDVGAEVLAFVQTEQRMLHPDLQTVAYAAKRLGIDDCCLSGATVASNAGAYPKNAPFCLVDQSWRGRRLRLLLSRHCVVAIWRIDSAGAQPG